MDLIKETAIIGETVFADSFDAVSDGDVIVPDIKPDILKVLQVDASSCIASKEISAGRLLVSGRTDMTILYLADGEEGKIENIKISFDFSQRLEKPQITETCEAMVNADVSRVDFHVINSRKLSLKAVTTIECEILDKKEISFATGVDEENMQVCTQKVCADTLCGTCDEEFMLKESIEIPTGKASIGEILKVDYKICDKELKLLSGKVAARGVLNICVLYFDTSGCLEYTEAEIPFTEVFDCDGADDNADCELNFRICDCYFDLAQDNDGDNRIINIEILASAQIKATKNKEIDVISDCFLPGHETELICEEVNINHVIASATTQNAIRDVAVIDKNMPQIKGVYNVIAKAHVTRSVPQRDKLLVEGRIEAYILYISEDGQNPVHSAKKEIPFSYLLDVPKANEGMDCSVSAEVGHISYHLNVANEVELRCILNLSAKVSSDTKTAIISDIILSPIDKDKKKGIVIYFVQPGDTLWKIARSYYVSVDNIVKFNNINEKDELRIGKRLVIPAQCGA